ncbi:LysR family transcriptional regulator [Pseudooceanicola aestuarii]|uniref:LysR family transcriptional regulator n=1 Tax=Pseudooceanicola aestuarii TaxID=2697319 RepID=UPI0013D8BB57|nr:LysR family transcriptional regulator [Pseudooceanicola aestuarii]
MTLDQLRIFLAVAEMQHVTRAAQRLNMTQSAVSAAISTLEDRHGVALFDRVGRRIALNAAGALFVEEARRVLDVARRAEGALADLSGVPSGRLRISASQTVASYWLPAILVRYGARFPKVDLQLSAGNTATVTEDVREGRADIGFVEGRPQPDKLLKDVVARDRLVLIVGPDHPWSDGRNVHLRDLAQTSWIMREAGSGTRAAFTEELESLGLSPSALSVTMELPSNEACLAAVEAGQGATVLSRRAALAHLAGGRLREVRFRLALRHFTALRHPDRHPSLALRELLANLGSSGSTGPAEMPIS